MELEARLKNKGSNTEVVDGNLEPEGGNMTMYVTYPDGHVEVQRVFFLIVASNLAQKLNYCLWVTENKGTQ